MELCSPPPQLFNWGQTMVEVMKIMVTSLKRSHACTAIVHAPNPIAGHRGPTPLPETPVTHRQVSCGVTVSFSWVLVHKVLLCPPRAYFPVLCKFWQLYGGVNGDLLQEDLCQTHTQSSFPAADHCQSVPPQEMLKHSSVSVSVGSLGPMHIRFV